MHIGTKLRIYTFDVALKDGYAGFYTTVGSSNVASLELQRSAGLTKIAEYDDPGRKPGEKTVVFLKEF
jgi:hypothetical protein